jgi:hypothetical protein
MTTSQATPPTTGRREGLGSRAFGLAQKLGRALMVPVAVLPAAGILLGIGGGILGGVQAGTFHIASPFVLGMLQVMKSSGDAVFGALPLMFAIGVVIALTKNDGVAALAAAVGYLVLLGAMSAVAKLFDIPTGSVLGFTTVDTGVFGGIVMGVVAASLFNRFYRIQGRGRRGDPAARRRERRTAGGRDRTAEGRRRGHHAAARADPAPHRRAECRPVRSGDGRPDGLNRTRRPRESRVAPLFDRRDAALLFGGIRPGRE